MASANAITHSFVPSSGESEGESEPEARTRWAPATRRAVHGQRHRLRSELEVVSPVRRREAR
ncbi:hypothetical protein MUK42_22915 [Musa troglodytarum]|uniref:Uncharacterized protein n=1 Tax=Musa troglodytarum TaxID=320322 RepID=A0A9E7ER01_9LILI|nr:hypothetical protein MUK42_22915 [Musa troglodytarum]